MIVYSSLSCKDGWKSHDHIILYIPPLTMPSLVIISFVAVFIFLVISCFSSFLVR